MNVGIVGLGLMGGSIAQGLLSNHFIRAYDINLKAIDYAKRHHWIHEGTNDITDFAKELDVVYLCLYPTQIVPFMLENQKYFLNPTLFIDIAGIKEILVNSILPILSPQHEFVFTHPIAGREKIGVEFSKPSIFHKANYIITPHEKNTPSALKQTEDLAIEMGFGKITYVSPKEHDDMIAYTSQLTHLLSLALVHSERENDEVSRFIGDSYRDLTRIAMINEPLWSELFLTNKESLLNRLHAFQASLSTFEQAIQNNDIEPLQSLMKEAKQKRLKIEKE